MAVLTADQVEYIRAVTGEGCIDDVSAALLQRLYARSGDDECVTIVEVLRVRVAKASSLVNQSTESGQSQSFSQKYTHLKAMLSDWEQRCGVSGGVLEMGTFDLRLDTDDEDEEV